MPIKDMQQKALQIGRIKIGAVVKAKNGKDRPAKLEAFRFTTNSRQAADATAGLFGGEVREWAGGTQKWEVFTTATELDIMIPPGEAVSQWYELWTAGGAQRRCDGFTDTISGKPCLCPPAGLERVEAAKAGYACKPTTRLNVILPDLPGIGVWRYDSGGFYAAVELGGAAEMLSRARAAGVIVPARLRLEQRQAKRFVQEDGESKPQTRNYPVVVLDIAATLRELASGTTGGSLRDALPPPPVAAITAGPQTAPESQPRSDRSQQSAPAGSELPDWPADAQALHAAATAAATTAELIALGKHARESDWMNDLVEVAPDVLEPLESFLFNRLAELNRPAEQEAS